MYGDVLYRKKDKVIYDRVWQPANDYKSLWDILLQVLADGMCYLSTRLVLYDVKTSTHILPVVRPYCNHIDEKA